MPDIFRLIMIGASYTVRSKLNLLLGFAFLVSISACSSSTTTTGGGAGETGLSTGGRLSVGGASSAAVIGGASSTLASTLSSGTQTAVTGGAGALASAAGGTLNGGGSSALASATGGVSSGGAPAATGGSPPVTSTSSSAGGTGGINSILGPTGGTSSSVAVGGTGDLGTVVTGGTGTGGVSNGTELGGATATATGGLSAGGTGSSAVATGGATSLTCPAPTADCDGDATNGCETNLNTSVAHCGACAAVCDGWCHTGACTPFQVIAENQSSFPTSRGIAPSDPDFYWVSSASADSNASKWRVQRKVGTGSVETLLANQDYYLGGIVMGAQRIFVLDVYNRKIQSMKTDGSDLRTDQTYAWSLRFKTGRIYFYENYNGAIYIKSQSETTPSDVKTEYGATEPAYGNANYTTIGDIAFDYADRLAFMSNVDTTGSNVMAYNINLVASSSTTSAVLSSQAGTAYRLEYDRDYYWIAYGASGSSNSLLTATSGAASPQAISTDVSVSDFTLFERMSGWVVVYYAYYDSANHTYGIRMYDTSRQQTYDILNGYNVGSLVTDDNYLYFFESAKHRLVKLPLPHVVLKL